MRYAMALEYDGSPFMGWQKHTTGATIQAEVERALSFVANAETAVVCSGRTDARVRHCCIGVRRKEGVKRVAHECPMSIQLCKQRSPVGETHGNGNALPVVILRRQCLCLGVVEILQAMLQIAQKGIGSEQSFHLRCRQQAHGGEAGERLPGGSRLQITLMSAANELLQLEKHPRSGGKRRFAPKRTEREKVAQAAFAAVRD